MQPAVSFNEPLKEQWYRYESKYVAHGGINMLGEWESSHSGHVELVLNTYTVKRHTPKGVRLTNDRVVLHASTKKFAHSNIAEALESFIKRKERHISILQAQLQSAQEAKTLAEGELHRYDSMHS